MITPAYPAMNSTLSVSRQTLQIMQDEFHRAHEIVDQLWKDYQRNPSQDMNWGKLFEPTDFFISYPVSTINQDFSTSNVMHISHKKHTIYSDICHYVLLDQHKKMHKHGQGLSNHDYGNWFQTFWDEV